ncbi:Hypothetical predicted protein [Olea europaea subsp. europaea]|uniref:Uncharacterized protein n=1 Tax=Olea europaea subsp. europaea TaxID=158383 RepID=A0A8S0UJL5_OLEEU|nr:Hypothetical predicted protein [Olea europaea subsp. europaea]
MPMASEPTNGEEENDDLASGPDDFRWDNSGSDWALGADVPYTLHPIELMQDWPEESPMLWNSESLNQIENDVAPMKKKRGTAQKPMIVAHSSNNLSRDDDTEDGCDPANQSSSDLRKFRMRFSQGQPSDDSFNEGELLLNRGTKQRQLMADAFSKHRDDSD